MRRSQTILIAFLFLMLACGVAFAQLTTAEEKGLPANSAFASGDVDVVNLQNGNLHITIPIYQSTQRGGKTLSWSLMYDTQTWVKQWYQNNCGGWRCNPVGQYVVIQHPSVVSGWRFSDPTDWEIANVDSGDSATQLICPGTGNPYVAITNWTVIDPEGSQHPLPLRQEQDYGCNGQMLSGPTLDGSGIVYDSVANVFYLKDGTQIGNGEIRDTNGNLYTFANAKDANGRTPVTVTAGPMVTFTSPMGARLVGEQYTNYTVLDAEGNPQTYRVDYQAVDFTSNSCGWTINPNQMSPYSCAETYQPMIEPTKVTLPDLRTYVFTFNNNSPGELARLDLPTGASIAYTYTDFFQIQLTHGQQSSYAGGRAVTTRAVTADGATQTWNYALNNDSMQTVVTDPVGNVTTHVFSTITASENSEYFSANRFEISTVYADATGHTLRTVNTDYLADVDPVNNTTANVRPIRKTTILDNGQVVKKETDYETFSYTCACAANTGIATRMNPTEERVYDYGAGSPGALLQRTDYTYLHTNNAAYTSLNIVNKPSTVIIYDGSGNIAAQSAYEYDVYTHPSQSMMASNAIQHDSSFGTSYNTRGNRTGTSKWRSTDGVYLTTTTQYDDAGNVLSTVDPLGHQSFVSYTDSWGGNAACVPSSGLTMAFPTTVTNAEGQSTSSTYNACTGSVSSTTDLNGKTTSSTYDFMGRPQQVLYPDGGSKTLCYSDDPNGLCYSTTALSSQETDAIFGSTSLATTTLYDSLGRVKESQVNSDPNGAVYVDTQYDPDGRHYKTSNPYRSGDTLYWTTNSYDGLGRLSSVLKTDGSSTATVYSGNTTTITDEAGHQRKSQTNGLGQLTFVWEDPAGLNYETDYSYDVLGNLLQATQKGGDSNSADWRIRTFTYNSLSQLLCSANPEIGSPNASVATCPMTDSGSYIAGTVRYAYDNDGEMISKTAPSENQQGSSTVTTTMTYDVLHRLRGKSYTDATPAVSYTYDDSAAPCKVPALTATNLMGRMSAMCDGSGATAWSYDPMGRTSTEVRTIGSVTDQIGYSYYLNGAVKTVTYPQSGAATPFVMTYHENAAGRTDSATGSDGVTYAQVSSTWASGAANVWQLGSNIQRTDTYNARLQPLVTTAEQISTTNTLFSRSYNFGVGTNDNGNLYGVVDGLDSLGLAGRPHGSVNYTYDVLNRIAGAATLGRDCTAVSGGTRDWGSTYVVDAWGNLTAKSSTVCVGETMPVATSNNRNRLSTESYDSAGNATTYNGVGFTYDAEGRLVNGSGSVYTYDGMGERVSKPGKLYWKGVGSTALVETDANDLNPTKYIFFNGARIARLDPGATAAKFYVADNVGSTALVTDAGGNVLNESLFFPYGVERVISQADTANNYKFSGKERDVETGLDDFGARYYDSALGRFMTPDWDAKATAVPYASFGDPQTLNLYAYVENGPLDKVDADGHSPTVYLSGDPMATSEDEGFKNDMACLGDYCMLSFSVLDATANSGYDTAAGQPDPSQPQVESAKTEKAQQQTAPATTTKEKIDNAVEKVNSIIPNPFNLVVKAYKLYRERQLLKQLNELSNTSIDVMLNTSGKETAQSMGIAADNYMWAQKEIIKLGGASASDAVGLAEGILGKMPSNKMSGTEKAITTGVSQAEKQIKDLVPNPQ